MKVKCWIATAALVFLVLGCSVSQDISLRADGSGTAELQMSVHPVMIAYYNDLMVAMSGVEGEFPIFDVEALQESFDAREGAQITALDQTSRGSLSLSVSFADLSSVFAESSAPVFVFERSGNRRTVTLRLDRAAIDGFLAFAPEETASMTQFLFPPADGSMTADEFEEQMSWALEEYGEPAEVRAALRHAVIEVRVRPDGRILSVEGGQREGGVAVFRIPVIEALTLSESRIYSLVFSP